MLSAFRPAFRRAFSVSSARCAANEDIIQETLQATVGQLEVSGNNTSKSASVPPAPPLPPLPLDQSQSKNPVILVPPDEDPLLNYFASRIMKHGRRQRANRVISRTLLHIHAFTRAPPLPIFREAVLAAAPAVRLVSQRHSTKTIYTPVAISERKRTWYAVEWLLNASATRAGKTLEERLAREMLGVLQGESGALTKKKELHTMALVNRYVFATLWRCTT